MRGVTTGMLRTHYQDWLFQINHRKGRHLTDEELANEMNREHPMGKPIPPSQVRSIRRRYNAGSQRHGPPADGSESFPYDENRQKYAYPRTGWRRDDQDI